MSFAAQLHPASFRGVPFGVLGAQKDFGRYVITHVFPKRDTPFHEDMELGPRAFAIDAFVVGADVVARARLLEAALEQPGPGLLVHPYYGALNVVALRSATTFAAYEGRVARVQMAFEEAGTSALPGGLVNTVAALVAGVAVVAASVLGAVVAAMAVTGQAPHVRESLAADLASGGRAIRSAVQSSGLMTAASGIGAVVTPETGRAMSIADALDRLSAMTADTLGDGSAAADLTVATIRALALIPTAVKSFATDPDEQVRVADTALAILGTVAGRPGDRVETANRAAVTFMADAMAAAVAAEAATTVEWDSRDQLAAYSERIAAALEAAADQAGAQGWDEAWRGLCDLGARWADHVARISPPLPRVRRVTLPATQPASLIAYRLDGDELETVFARGGRIALRNRVRHPGFVPGGVPLEVVANG